MKRFGNEIGEEVEGEEGKGEKERKCGKRKSLLSLYMPPEGVMVLSSQLKYRD